MQTQIKITKGQKYLLNYSGIEIEGILINTIYINTPYFQFEIIDPFTKIKRLQNFIRMDIIKPILSIVFILLSFSIQAQTSVKIDAKGNYIAIAKTSAKGTSKATTTGKTYTDAKGIKYNVMKSEKGKLFIVRTSKSGKTYNQYLKIN